MKRNKSKDIPSWAKTGHSKPVTRRELLAHGIIPFAGTLFAPQMMQLLLSSTASAQSAAKCATSVSTFAPFIHLNLSGGAAMSSNFVPMNASGAPLASYSKMGLGNGQVPIEREFGGGTFAGTENGALLSKMLEGIRSIADTDTVSRTSFIGVCVRSRDDSGENAANISGLVVKAGLNGSHLPNLGTRSSSSTGVNDMPAVLLPPTPLIVRNFRDITNSLGYSAAIGTQLNNAQKVKLANLVSGLSAQQSRKLASLGSGEQLQKLVECAGIKNNALVEEGTGAVNPVLNAAVGTIWQINNGSNQGSNDYVFGSMVYNALQGYAGATGLEMGGYDYHDNTRNTGNTRDRNAGVTIGRILQTAKVLQKPVFLYVTSDGGVNSPESDSRTAPWSSDRGSAGAAYIFMYNPTSRPAVSANQIGHFTDAQVADDKFPIGNDVSRAAQAVFANYLQFNKRMGDFNKVVGRNALDASVLSQVIKVA
jgi:hypothetical protein